MNQTPAPGMQFESTGIFGPVPVLSRDDCRQLKRMLRSAPPPLDWGKGHAANSRAFYDIGSHPSIIDRVAGIIGDDVMLWGATLIKRKPGQEHPWHTDIETSADEPGTVTVWMGLQNTNRNSSLRLIPGSHRFGITIQERAAKAGRARADVTVEDVTTWANEIDPESGLVQFDMSDGDAVFFDGRLWHGSLNTNQEGVRLALLLQYATPEREMRIPDLRKLDFPFRSYDEPRPPCVMIRGSGASTRNRILPPPESEQTSSPSWIRRLHLPLAEDEQTGWMRYPIHRGPTRAMTSMTCHASVLSPEKTPHEPHSHAEEEILIVLDGEPELVIVDADGNAATHSVRCGQLVYYPAHQVHTIHNSSAHAATYLMFKWSNEISSEVEGKLETNLYAYDEAMPDPHMNGGRKMRTRRVFEGPTGWLSKLHCHTTSLAPGGGYEPHADPYDVAILVLDGSVETLGAQLEPFDLVFYAAGELHGMRNRGEASASYIVFEFHGDSSRI